MKLDILAYQQALRQARLAVFDESKHPRGPGGRWARKGASLVTGAPKPQSVHWDKAWDANPARRDAVQRAVSGLLARFPIPLRSVDVMPEADEFGQLAGKSNDTIYVSPRFLDDEFMDRHLRSWRSVSTQVAPEDVIVHEFGHVLDGWLLREHTDAYRQVIDSFFAKEIEYEVGGRKVKAPLWQAGDGEQVSAYAQENRFEFFAEAFTDWYLNGTKAKKRSRELGALIERAMKPSE